MDIYEDFLSIDPDGNRNIFNTYFTDKELSIKMIPATDRILSKVFNYKEIKRVSEVSDLDQKYHIDIILKNQYGIKKTIQEKALRYIHRHYNTITIEYMQDRFYNVEGEFFNLFAQYYFSGYTNKEETDYIKWIVVNIPALLENYKDIPHVIKPTSDAISSFIAFNYEDIPKSCIIESWSC